MKKFHKKYPFFSVFSVLTMVLLLCAEARAASFSLQKKLYFSATYFELTDGLGPYGTVVRSNWQFFGSTYEGYDAAGAPSFEARTRPFGLGNLFAWAQHIEVRDAYGMVLGVIDGEFWTMATARFRIYDAMGMPVGVAYVDRSNVGATVMPADGRKVWLARFTRLREADYAPDRWEAEIFPANRVHPHVLTALGCVLSDLQESLFPDTANF